MFGKSDEAFGEYANAAANAEVSLQKVFKKFKNIVVSISYRCISPLDFLEDSNGLLDVGGRLIIVSTDYINNIRYSRLEYNFIRLENERESRWLRFAELSARYVRYSSHSKGVTFKELAQTAGFKVVDEKQNLLDHSRCFLLEKVEDYKAEKIKALYDRANYVNRFLGAALSSYEDIIKNSEPLILAESVYLYGEFKKESDKYLKELRVILQDYENEELPKEIPIDYGKGLL